MAIIVAILLNFVMGLACLILFGGRYEKYRRPNFFGSRLQKKRAWRVVLMGVFSPLLFTLEDSTKNGKQYPFSWKRMSVSFFRNGVFERRIHYRRFLRQGLTKGFAKKTAGMA